uniref:Uncharacterized protein n=1 Tax=Rhizophora mucronata TaxID=61149 RepID=A0A2P2JCC6_RHIMU
MEEEKVYLLEWVTYTCVMPCDCIFLFLFQRYFLLFFFFHLF